MKRIVFFLRHNNDIDHITPVVWALRSYSNIQSTIILINSDHKCDPRLKYLESSGGVNIICLDDMIGRRNVRKLAISNGHISMNYIENRIRRILNRRFNIPIKRESKRIQKQVWFIAEKIINKIIENGETGIVVFDWISDNMPDYLFFAKCISAHAKQYNIKILSLPHGDEPHYCKMIRINELKCKDSDIYKGTKDIFDYVVVPNKLCEVRYLKHMGEERVKTLGSPRYNSEWTDKISNIYSKDINDMSSSGDGEEKLRILFYLRSGHYPIFWEEVVRTIKMIRNMPSVRMIVAHHSRNMAMKRLFLKYPVLKPGDKGNVRIIAGDINPAVLNRWADVVLDVGTSAAFEAITLGKPVFELEYLHATYTTISEYFKESVVMCRDELLRKIQENAKNRNSSYYNDHELKKFNKDVLGDENKYVLKGYSEYITSLMQEV